MMPIYTPHKQKGTVLVTVLMMFAIAAFLASEMAYRQKLDVRRTSAMLMTEQAREYLMAAEELSMLALKDDLKADKKQSKKIDGLGEEWALKRPPFPVEGGLIQGEIIDAQSKFNLNDLVDPATGKGEADKPRAKLAQAQFKKLLQSLDIPKEGSSEALVEKIVDWMDTGQDETGTDGREDSAYLSAKRPHRTSNRVFVDVSELRSIEEIDNDTYTKLEPHVVALPPGTPLNINTAEQEILDTLGIDTAKLQNFIAQRERNPADESDIATYAPTKDSIKTTYSIELKDDEVKGLVSTNSTYFELKAKAVIGERTVYSRSLIYRPPEGAPNGNSGKLEVIYRAYVDPLQQPMTPLINNNNQSE